MCRGVGFTLCELPLNSLRPGTHRLDLVSGDIPFGWVWVTKLIESLGPGVRRYPVFDWFGGFGLPSSPLPIAWTWCPAIFFFGLRSSVSSLQTNIGLSKSTCRVATLNRHHTNHASHARRKYLPLRTSVKNITLIYCFLSKSFHSFPQTIPSPLCLDLPRPPRRPPLRQPQPLWE